MKFWSRTSNSNLAFALLALALAAGCASRQKKKDEEISTIRLHMEVNPQMVRRNMQVSILRAQPVLITVGESYVMHEGYLNRAEIIEANGVHNVRLQFVSSGSRLLETETSVNLGRRLAVFAQFPEGRWLAAPVVSSRITNGVFTFTPDANLEETRRLVDGLNLVIEKRRKQDKFILTD